LKTGLRFVLYDFRHTFATRMAESGIDLATLAAILGHSSLRSVMKYVHPTAQHQFQAMARYEETRRATQQTEVLQ
jgi:integrase